MYIYIFFSYIIFVLICRKNNKKNNVHIIFYKKIKFKKILEEKKEQIALQICIMIYDT